MYLRVAYVVLATDGSEVFDCGHEIVVNYALLIGVNEEPMGLKDVMLAAQAIGRNPRQDTSYPPTPLFQDSMSTHLN